MSNTAPGATIKYSLTFLAREIPPEIRNTLPKRSVDIYVPENNAVRPILRLRRNGDNYEITKRTPLKENDPSVYSEHTIALNQAEFESLTSGHSRLIEKDRYKVVLNGRPAAVDIFSGKLEGLVLIDFNFINEADKAAFTPPACCLIGVTDNNFIAGGMLAGKSYADIARELATLKYESLHL